MVHNLPMKKTTKEKYLVSNSGNNPNIENRRKIGFKAISDILPMLKEDGSTSFYILCGLIFRDAVLKCKLLLNSEVWHGLNANQVNKLEDIDKTFIEIFWTVMWRLEQSACFRSWENAILHVDKSELIFRVYQGQLNSTHPGDWVRLVAKDKQRIWLDLNDEEIKATSREFEKSSQK